MKIAVISDIHGNIIALDSVLKSIKQENCEKIFCLGDIIMAGPNPKETMDKIIELNKDINFNLICGNTDLMLISDDKEAIINKLEKLNPIMKNAYISDIKTITKEQKEFLKSLNEKLEININGKKILFVHGSPRKIDENIYPNLKIEQVEEMIQNTNADIIFCGHTHIPCGYQTNTNQTVVNVGSVGRPFSLNPKSVYCILNCSNNSKILEIEHKYVEYDVKKASEIMKKRNFEGAEKLAKMLICATSRYPE